LWLQISAAHVLVAMQAACIFLIQRGDCDTFAPCYAKDPAYAQAVRAAHAAGVILIPLLCEADPRAGEIIFLRAVQCDLEYGMGA
jgi:DNA-binding sugar fermentation-stimulating protein